ncbi:DUF4399 domain-containing protein [Variovorax sp. J22P271]|uniref:DUF4399 domain-containing protein n=1 Tax=Variovorax davisae TaxID=3053515 RepID=UPI002574CA4B|nr:DUF4399 domain-containing protein [Variovorax sp. J22P271]MDM0032604.1 DUF4399 domain-containing protein [Variovorax sp. J22P271]
MRQPERRGRRAIEAAAMAALMLAAAGVAAQAADAPAAAAAPSADGTDLVAHPWVVPPPNWSPEAYFSNLKDGATMEAPFVARFGLSMRGIVPAGKTAGSAGHHHLLINQPLPLDFTKPLPFTEHYIHFGKGQMETVVDLPPGSYTMRLVLADQGHIPYFVYSKPLRFTVSKQNKGVTAASLLGAPHIELLSPADRSTVQLPLRVQFHASGLNVSNAAPKVPETGHFRLVLERPGQKAEAIELEGGQTELWLNPPKGSYNARLELISNTAAGSVVARAKPVAFTVP